MEDIQYYLVYDPNDNEAIYVTTNLEAVKKDTEESGTSYIEIAYYE